MNVIFDDPNSHQLFVSRNMFACFITMYILYIVTIDRKFPCPRYLFAANTGATISGGTGGCVDVAFLVDFQQDNETGLGGVISETTHEVVPNMFLMSLFLCWKVERRMTIDDYTSIHIVQCGIETSS